MEGRENETNKEAREPLNVLPRSFSIADIDAFVWVWRVVVLEELTAAGGEIGATTSVLALEGREEETRWSQLWLCILIDLAIGGGRNVQIRWMLHEHRW